MATYRFAAVYIGPKKVGEIEQFSLSFMSNGEQLVSADEVAESDGVITAEGSFDTIEPFGSKSVDVIAMVLNRDNVEVGVVMSGKLYKVPGRIIRNDFNSVVKSGVSKGKYQFRGGTPKVI